MGKYWGHPDDWSDDEWRDWNNRKLRRQGCRDAAKIIVLTIISVVAIYWLGIGF